MNTTVPDTEFLLGSKFRRELQTQEKDFIQEVSF